MSIQECFMEKRCNSMLFIFRSITFVRLQRDFCSKLPHSRGTSPERDRKVHMLLPCDPDG